MLIDISTCFGKSPKKRLRYANGVTGMRMFGEPGPPTTQEIDWSLDNLLAVLDKHQVDRALTYSLRGKMYDFVDGNEETWQAGQNHPQLIPVATIDPQRYFGCREEIQRCVDRGFRIFRFFPDEQGWSISALPFLKICEELAEHDVAVMLPAGGQTTIGTVICPFGFNVVAIGAGYANVTESIVVAAEYENFFCETSLIHTADTISAMVAEIGAHQLVFGSNSPESYFEAAYNLVADAQLSAAHKDAILGGNARQYLPLEEWL